MREHAIKCVKPVLIDEWADKVKVIYVSSGNETVEGNAALPTGRTLQGGKINCCTQPVGTIRAVPIPHPPHTSWTRQFLRRRCTRDWFRQRCRVSFSNHGRSCNYLPWWQGAIYQTWSSRCDERVPWCWDIWATCEWCSPMAKEQSYVLRPVHFASRCEWRVRTKVVRGGFCLEGVIVCTCTDTGWRDLVEIWVCDRWENG